MNNIEYQRRVAAQWGVSEDKFKDFLLGEFGCTYGDFNSSREVKPCLTPLIEIIPGHSITLNSAMPIAKGDYIQHLLYKSSKEYLDARDVNPIVRTMTVIAGAAYVRMTFDFFKIEQASVYDNTTQEYLWRGSDYVD